MSKEQLPDPLHPDGRCTCGNEGTCDWCQRHCGCCGATVEPGEHECPFRADVWGDTDYQCNCCDSCRGECADDI